MECQASRAGEPTTAQILWDRGQNLRQGSYIVKARKLLRQLDEKELVLRSKLFLPPREPAAEYKLERQ
jgi:hypothetical protein